jgi:hypothetical protein
MYVDRTGQVWEMWKYRDAPPVLLVFTKMLENDGNVTRYRTFDLDSGDTDVFDEYYHYPLEKHAKWQRLG